jgi:hypothetical protein
MDGPKHMSQVYKAAVEQSVKPYDYVFDDAKYMHCPTYKEVASTCTELPVPNETVGSCWGKNVSAGSGCKCNPCKCGPDCKCV